MKIQNEQLNTLRMTLKDEQLLAATHRQSEHEWLSEFMRLNNELVNTQRELALRNADLADANTLLEPVGNDRRADRLEEPSGLLGIARTRIRPCRRATALPLSLLMLDVDHFKQFNDQFGHPAGDEVLKGVARILTGESRSETLVARYGGEEFALMLPNCGREAIAGIAERVRLAIERGPWPLPPHHPQRRLCHDRRQYPGSCRPDCPGRRRPLPSQSRRPQSRGRRSRNLSGRARPGEMKACSFWRFRNHGSTDCGSSLGETSFAIHLSLAESIARAITSSRFPAIQVSPISFWSRPAIRPTST